MALAREEPILELPDTVAWARSLSANHAQSMGVWLKLAKKGSPEVSVTQAEAIEEAVCFGWIDGRLARPDEHFFRQRFTVSRNSEPRRPTDASMMLARRRVRQRFRRTCGQPPCEHPKAREFFDTLTGAERYKFLYRLHHTKDPRRRADRIAHYVELLGQRKTLARG